MSDDPRNVLAYAAAGNSAFEAAFLDGHVETLPQNAFKQALRETYKRLNREDELPAAFR